MTLPSFFAASISSRRDLLRRRARDRRRAHEAARHQGGRRTGKYAPARQLPGHASSPPVKARHRSAGRRSHDRPGPARCPGRRRRHPEFGLVVEHDRIVARRAEEDLPASRRRAARWPSARLGRSHLDLVLADRHRHRLARAPAAARCVASVPPPTATWLASSALPARMLLPPMKRATKPSAARRRSPAACRSARCGRGSSPRSGRPWSSPRPGRASRRPWCSGTRRAAGGSRSASPRAGWRRGCESGSSSSRISGSTTSARASATRCCWPPDSSPG